MRLCLVCSLGLLSTACGLSMNPDLPSTEEGNSPPFGGEAEPIDNGAPDGIIDGAGELPPHFGAPSAAGGTAGTGCVGPGGAGGAENCGEVP